MEKVVKITWKEGIATARSTKCMFELSNSFIGRSCKPCTSLVSNAGHNVNNRLNVSMKELVEVIMD